MRYWVFVMALVGMMGTSVGYSPDNPCPGCVKKPFYLPSGEIVYPKKEEANSIFVKKLPQREERKTGGVWPMKPSSSRFASIPNGSSNVCDPKKYPVKKTGIPSVDFARSFDVGR